MDKHCIIRKKSESIREYIRKNNGLAVIYGATYWGGVLTDNGIFKIDCFCDQKAPAWQMFHDTRVINIDELETRIKDSGKRATIIIASQDSGNILSIYMDLMRKDLDADVFNYFENEIEFSDLEFSLSGKKYSLFQHSINCGYFQTRMTERSVELALAQAYVDECNGSIAEIGAVTPYYFFSDKITEIIDPTDIHKRAIPKSIFACDLKGKNVLSISTVEHIGTSDFGMHESENAIDAIDKILAESNSCLITVPLGYNKLLDGWVMENHKNGMVSILRRFVNNHWEEIVELTKTIEYTTLWANGLAVIKKNCK